MAQGTQVRSMPAYVGSIPRRPGWVTFGAVISFVVGVFYALTALSEFSNSYWLYGNVHTNVYSLAGAHLFWWGIFDVIIAAIAIGAGVSLLRGGVFGLVTGITGASFSAVRWLFYIPAVPWLAITLVVIDLMVVFGLAASMDFFDSSADARPN